MTGTNERLGAWKSRRGGRVAQCFWSQKHFARMEAFGIWQDGPMGINKMVLQCLRRLTLVWASSTSLRLDFAVRIRKRSPKWHPFAIFLDLI